MTLKTKAFGDIITFTRASGGGRFNAQGVYEWLPANEPRIDYNPVTGECRGLLIEESRTNQQTQSSNVANSAWAKVGLTATANVITAPDGTTTGNKLTESTASGQHYANMAATISITGGNQYTYSVYAKAGERKGLALVFALPAFPSNGRRGYFNLETGHVITAEPGVTAAIKDAGGGWYRCSVSAAAETTGAAVAGYLTMTVDTSGSFASREYVGDGTSGIYIWGAQFEAGAFPTSYIPTTTAQVTRAADVASVNELSPWYNASEGTLVVEVAPIHTTSANWAAALSNSATGLNDLIDLGWSLGGSPGARGRVLSGGTTQAEQFVAPGAVTGQTINMAVAYATDSVQTSARGMVSAKDTSATIPSVNRLQIGRVGAFGYSPGHIQSIRYFPRRLSNTELQEITA